ncbi:hypothetical protein, partial [Escherichia coli]
MHVNGIFDVFDMLSI